MTLAVIGNQRYATASSSHTVLRFEVENKSCWHDRPFGKVWVLRPDDSIAVVSCVLSALCWAHQLLTWAVQCCSCETMMTIIAALLSYLPLQPCMSLAIKRWTTPTMMLRHSPHIWLSTSWGNVQSTDPCGTPNFRDISPEWELTQTSCLWYCRNSAIQPGALPSTEILLSTTTLSAGGKDELPIQIIQYHGTSCLELSVFSYKNFRYHHHFQGTSENWTVRCCIRHRLTFLLLPLPPMWTLDICHHRL